jgi:hypothetical protein
LDLHQQLCAAANRLLLAVDCLCHMAMCGCTEAA